jgi:hypothetical protein
MNCAQTHISRHAFERMFQRAISPTVVTLRIQADNIIARYPDDRPFPSVLMLGFDGDRPIHIVVARDSETSACYVVTVYVPDPTLWNETFTERKRT